MKNSEFILTPEGEIYHLQLRPGDLATNIITVGDPERAKMIKKYFDEVYLERQNREFLTITGRIGNTDLSVISTGIGCDNIDIVLNEVDALFNVDFELRQPRSELQSLDIFRLGTSGSLQEDIDAGELVISEAAFGIDNLMHFYEWENDNQHQELIEKLEAYLAIPIYFTNASNKLLDRFKDLTDKNGVTFTSNGFYGPQGRKIRMPISKPDFLVELGKMEHKGSRVTNFEMETAGIYALAAIMGHHALSINAILANRVKGTFIENPAKLVQLMLESSLEIIAKRE